MVRSRLIVFGLAGLVALTSAASASAQTGLVAAYGFNEGAGTITTDQSGNAQTGTLSGTSWSASGRFGAALSFNGSTSTVTVADSALLDLTSGMTLEAWVNATAAGNWRTVILKESTGSLSYALYASDDGSHPAGWIRSSADIDATSSSTLATNTWVHLAVTYNGSALVLYVNGVQAATRATTGAITTSGQPLRIGGNSIWGEYFSGLIDEVRIYNRALTATEIQTDMNTPLGAAPPPDTTFPTVSITAPAASANVSGTISVNATAADNVGVAGVQFKLDGVNLGAEDTIAPYSVSWNTTTSADGFRNLTAVARDAAGNATTSAPIGVTVANGGSSTWSLSGSITPIATGSGATVTLSGTSNAVVTADASGTFTFYGLANGPYTVTPSKSGFVYTPASRSVTVSGGNLIGVNFSGATVSTGIQLVQKNFQGYETSQSSISAAFTSNNTAGNFLIVSGTAARPAGTLTISDTAGNTYIPAITAANDPGQDVNAFIWYVPNCKAGPNTVTLTPTSSRALELHISEWTGIDPSSPLDKTAWAAGTNATLASSGPVTPSMNGELIFGHTFIEHEATAGAGFTPLSYINGDLDEYLIQPVAASVAATFTQQVSAGYIVLVATFRPVAAVDTTPPDVTMTSPAPGSVYGPVAVTASASDNVGVYGVQFRLDGVNLGAEVMAAPYSVAWNTITASEGSHTLTATARDAAGNVRTSASLAVTVGNTTNPGAVGQWATPTELGLVAVNMVMLHTGKILMYTGEFATSGVERVWDPVTGVTTMVPNPYFNLFCSGHSQLADGRILVVGGYDNSTLGAADANIFDPVALTWTKLANMSYRRWYPTATTLPNGKVLVTSGAQTCLTCLADVPELFDPATNQFTPLTSARLSAPYYPFMYVLPDGRILDAGANEQTFETRTLDPNTWTWTMVDPVVRDGHSSAMYRPGKILKTGTAGDSGTAGNAAPTAYVLDMTQPSPAWRQVASMAFPRAFQNTTLLPDGTVLVTGGGTTRDGYDVNNSVKTAELWSPATETWKTLVPAALPRLYHSTALLLPDGRVLTAGSGNDGPAVNQTQAEFYSPPYLFKGARPTITGAPSTIQYGAPFTVQTPDAASIASIALIRPGAVTHAFDEDQRFLNLTFVAGAGALTVQAPANANLAPPGYYMLFIVNTAGVPSVAPFVSLPVSAGDTTSPTAPGALMGQGGIGSASLTWTASTDNIGVATYNVHRSTVPGFVASAANRVGQSASTSFFQTGVAPGTYYYVVTAQDLAGNVSAPSNEEAVVVFADTTPPTVSFSSPVNLATVTGSITVSANASDNVVVAGVQFKLDGALLGPEDLTSPYSVTWSTAATSNGPHVLTAVARDAGGNVAQAVISVTVSNTAPPPPTGLVLAYGFNEGAGTQATDLSGSGNAGTITAATWTAGGKFGSALSFNGTSAQVTVADTALLDLTAGMTLEAWIYPASNTSWRTVMLKEAASTMSYALYGANGGSRPAAWAQKSGSDYFVNASSTPTLNTWTHLTATYDGTSLRLYVNGALEGTSALPGGLLASTGALRIGGNSLWGEYFSGLIDEVRIYNRALTAAEIQTDMSTPVGGTPSTSEPTITWATPADIVHGTPLGSTQLNATASVAGSFAYTPPAGTVLPVGVGHSLSVTFTPTDTVLYSTVSAGVLLNVVNRAPVLTNPGNQLSPENASISLQMAASDPDGDVLSYSANGLPASLTLNPSTGLISGTLSFTSAGTYLVTITVSDGSLTNIQAYTWTVTDVNRAPALTSPGNQTSAENATISLQLAASDPDGGALTYSASGLPASLTLNPATGLISGTLSFTSAGGYAVTATVSDGSLSNSQAFTWTVTDVNRAPSLTSPGNQASDENATISLQLSAGDPDGGALTYSASGLPPSLTLNSATGLISGTLSFTSAGDYSVTATVSDGSLSNSQVFTWTVTNVNRAPSLTGPQGQTSAENATISLQLAASDPDGGALTYSASGLPPSLALNPATGLISGTLSFSSAGTYAVTATVSDGSLSNSQTFAWTVTNVNRAPVLTSPGNQASAENTSVSLALAASDPDGEALTYSVAGLPPTLTVDAATGLISGLLSLTSAGTYPVTATVSDGSLSNSQTFTWVVADTNRPPVLTNPGAQTNWDVSGYAQRVLADAPSAYWRLGETAGTGAIDSAGINPGTVFGGVTLSQAGALADGNPAMSFNGSTGYVRVANNAALPLTGDLTIELWLNVSLATRQTLISKDYLHEFELTLETSGKLNFYQGNGTSYSGISSAVGIVAANTWQHVVVTRTGGTSTIRFYVNGIAKGSGTYVTAPTPGTKPISIGRSEGGAQYVNGRLDEVALYPAALSGAQIAAHYAMRTSVGTPTVVALPLAASDPDGDGMTYGATGLPSGLTINGATGLISGTLTQTSVGIHQVTATASDGPLANSQTFTWTVTHVNRNPTLTSPGNQASAENTSVSLALAGSDPDGDAVTYSAAGLPPALSLDPATGVISGTLPFTSAGTYVVTATVSDGSLSSYGQTFTWAIANTNRAPFLASPGAQTHWDVSGYTQGALSDAPVAYWRLGEATGTIAADSAGTNGGTVFGGVTLGQSGALADGNPAMLFNGSTGYVRVANSAAVQLAGDLTIEVWVNASLAARQTVVSKDYLHEFELTLETSGKLNFYQGNGTAYQGISSVVGAVAANTWQHVVVTRSTGTNTIRFYVNGVAKGSGVYVTAPTTSTKAVSIGRSEGGAQYVSGRLDEVALYATALTAAQIAAHYGLQATVSAPTAVALQLVASDPDSDALTYSATGLPSGLTVNAATGLISGTLSSTSAGIHQVTATASDGNLSSSQTFAWTVTHINRSPALTSPGTQTSAENASISLQLTASDPDGDTLTYSATGLPASLSLDPATGLIGGTLSFTSAGTYVVTATVSDGSLASASQTFTWTVANTNRAPVLANPGAQNQSDISGYAQGVVADAPVAYWRLGETSGTSAGDSAGVNPGTVFGGVTLGQTGALADGNTAMLFNGSTGYVRAANSAVPLAGDLTIELWLNVSLATRQTLISKDYLHEFELTLETSGKLNFYQGNGTLYQGIQSPVGAVSANTWQHVVVTRTVATNTIRFYVNGILKGSGAYATAPTSSTRPITIGRSDGGTQYVSGRLDEVALYSAALSSTQVAAHYALRTSTGSATLVALQLVASDPDGESLTYNATSLPPGLACNPATGLISGTLSPASAGTYQVTITAADGGLSNSQTFTWTVTHVN